MTTKLTPHFTLEEMTFSATAKKFNILNEPTAPQIENLKYLCSEILEPLRSYYEDKPIRVTSGFRSPTLSEKIGSSKNSQHCQGCAVDFTMPGFDNRNVASHIKNNFIFRSIDIRIL
jgi:zinc D-Ala-D-Ala carboxypeptidase